MAYKTQGCIRRTSISVGQIKKKKQSTNIKRDKINITNVSMITLNLYKSLFNNDNWYMKVTQKSKLIEVAW